MMRLPISVEQQEHALAVLEDAVSRSATMSYVCCLKMRSKYGHNLNEAQTVINEVDFTRWIDSLFPAIRKTFKSRLDNSISCWKIP